MGATEAVKRETNYLFQNTRTNDLEPELKKINRPYKPMAFDLPEGAGVLFNPMQILHCGVAPTKGPRYTAQFCLTPSPVPWQEAVPHFGLPVSAGTWLRFEGLNFPLLP